MESHDLEQLFSSQWETTIQRIRLSLKPNDLDVLKSLVSWDTVCENVLDLPTQEARQFALAKPALGHLKTFTDIFETKLGLDLDAAFLWGLISILLQETSGSLEAAPVTLRMLRSIGYKADTFNACCAALPHMVNQMKEACFDFQIELVEFCVDAIKYMRHDYDSGTRRATEEDPVEQMEKRYASMNSELEKILVQIEKLVQFSISLAIHNKPKSSPVSSTAIKRPLTLLLPQTRTMRFFDRVDLFEKLDNAFGDSQGASFKSVALWGLGGIGKSSIALRYVETKVGKDEYDAMFWVHAEKDASMRQSFTDIALKLKLPEVRPQTHDENLSLVQGWLQSTDYRWLLVYDNVSTLGVLAKYWPVAGRGHVIITTRNSSVAFHQASSAVEVTSWDVKMGSEFLMFLLQKEIGKDLKKEDISAQELSRRVSGHALGISHIAGLMHRRAWTISEFMRIYLNNPRRVHGSEFEALWDFSFQSLNQQARVFLGVLSFLMPDDIPQSLFQGAERMPASLDFCLEEFDFSETIEGLLEISLIKRNRDTKAFSIHRMVQTQFKYFMDLPQLQGSFEDAVSIICRRFPKMGEKGQLYDEWAQCNALLQHVISLKDCFRDCHRANKDFKAPLEFCELLKEGQRYLYESNDFKELEDMCNVNIDAVGTLENQKNIDDLLPHIYSQQANMYEGLGDAKKAIELNKKGYEIRLLANPRDEPFCYGFESNIGYTHNTANDHESAMRWFEKARDRWLEFVDKTGKKESYPSVLKKNMARCLVHMGKTAEARPLLETAIAEFKSTKPLNWGMLAYAYQAMGLINRIDGDFETSEVNFFEAQNFWQQGDQSRLNPFYGGCLYKTGAVCLDQGKTEAAIKHLRDSLEVTRFRKDIMPVEYARTCVKLSEALLKGDPDDKTEAEDLREEAEVYLMKRDPDATDFLNEATYDRLIPIFWR